MKPDPTEKPAGLVSNRIVWAAGLALLALTGVIAWLAQSFPYEKTPGRPIVEVVWVSWIASAVSLIALYAGLRVQGKRKSLVGLVILMGIAMRIVLVFSNPILEVDFYRYLWDGIAANNGVAPYKFSPDAVLRSPIDDPELKTLQAEVAQNQAAHTIVSRVHFEQYTTLYPPVSQAVFRNTTALIPDDASVATHIAMLKLVLVLFDVGVVGCLLWMLLILEKHPAWLIAYAWNPLVLKEIANGGHLDSIAIFFMAAGIAVFLWGAKRIEVRAGDQSTDLRSRMPIMAVVVSAALMAMGVGAKLFPVIVLPAMFVYIWAQQDRKGSLAFAAVCCLVTAAVMWPMINPENRSQTVPVTTIEDTLEHAPAKTAGLEVFMTQWRMNDAIFSGVYQNVEPDWGEHGPAWCVFVPNETRQNWTRALADVKLALADVNPAFLIARLATVALFAAF